MIDSADTVEAKSRSGTTWVFVLVAGLLLAGVSAAAEPGAAAPTKRRGVRGKPNIVLIIGDDQGYRDFGFMGSEHVLTPNLDRLAAEGTLFRNGQSTSSICRPALRSLLTGFHPFQWDVRVRMLQKAGIRKADSRYIENFETLPGILQSVGYRSFQGGKIFEENHSIAGFTDGTPIRVENNGTFGEAVKIGRKTMDPILEFLDQHGNEPFFLWFAPMLPHTPHNAPDSLRAPFEGKGYSESAVAYYASILQFDESVGALIGALEERNLREHTLIVYVSDNGWDQGPHDEREDANRDGPRGKMTLYETGTRTPIIFNWPGRVPIADDGDEIVSIVDLFPTFLDYAGAKPRADRPGLSMRPRIEGRGDWQRHFVIGSLDKARPNSYRPRDWPAQNSRYPEPAYFYRDRRWRFIWNDSWGAVELYDLVKDPEQKQNLAVVHPKQTDHFLMAIKSWRVKMAKQVQRGQLPKPPPHPALRRSKARSGPGAR